MDLFFKRIHPNAKAPERQNSSDAGYDLFSCERHIIPPMGRKVIPIGIAIEIPFGYYGRIAPRSGTAIKNGVDVLAGVIDAGFRAELGVVLVNLNLPEQLFDKSVNTAAYVTMFGPKSQFIINPGDRVAQLIIERCYSADWKERPELNESERGEGGFGSTGA